MKRLTYTVTEAAALLGISRGAAYEAARNGQIPTVRIGKRLLVPIAAFHKTLDQPALDGSTLQRFAETPIAKEDAC